jgi:hypothetical protein
MVVWTPIHAELTLMGVEKSTLVASDFVFGWE